MNVTKKMMGAVTASFLFLAMVPASANAFALSKTFDFFGKCDDCAGNLVEMDRGIMMDGEMIMEDYLYTLFMLPLRETGDGIFQNVSGTLELQNFDPGVALDASNFVSFTYNGSSILDPFTIAMGDINTLSGTLDADGNVLSDVNINWNTTGPLTMLCGPVCNLDVLASGAWSLGPLMSPPLLCNGHWRRWHICRRAHSGTRDTGPVRHWPSGPRFSPSPESGVM